jgi:hypothetical protein
MSRTKKLTKLKMIANKGKILGLLDYASAKNSKTFVAYNESF